MCPGGLPNITPVAMCPGCLSADVSSVAMCTSNLSQRDVGGRVHFQTLPRWRRMPSVGGHVPRRPGRIRAPVTHADFPNECTPEAYVEFLRNPMCGTCSFAPTTNISRQPMPICLDTQFAPSASPANLPRQPVPICLDNQCAPAAIAIGPFANVTHLL